MQQSKRVVNSILVLGPAWIGDMVMAQALFKLLKAKNPRVSIDVLAPGWTLPLVDSMPEVRQGIHFPFAHGELKLAKRYEFAKGLRRHHYDQAIVLPSSFKSALIAFWAQIPIRTGWLGEYRFGLLNDVRILSRSEYPLMVQQFAALGILKAEKLTERDLYYPRLVIEQERCRATLDKLSIQTDRPLLALCPGAEFGPAKRWPIGYFASLAKEMLKRGWRVLLLGSQKERELAETLMVATDNQCIDLTGKTSLTEVMDALSVARVVISNDSGLMHIAAALNRPLLVIYGSSSPTFTPPLSKQSRVAKLELACSPCFKRMCPLGHFNCMNQMTPDYMLSQLESLLKDTHNG
jgi:heptosyltransferase-2